jgi:hypothetical protein
MLSSDRGRLRKVAGYVKWIIFVGLILSYFIYTKQESKRRNLESKQANIQRALNFDIEDIACEMIKKDIDRFKDSPRTFLRVSEEYLVEKSIAIVHGGVRRLSQLYDAEKSSGDIKYAPTSTGAFLMCRDDYEIWKRLASFPEVSIPPAVNSGNSNNSPVESLVPQKISKGTRLALVIGNSKYTDKPLRNPLNDSEDLAVKLLSLGFDVILVRDGTLEKMKMAIRDFGNRIQGYESSLIYYSGHGIEYRGRNYLIPVDASIRSEEDIIDQAIDAALIMSKIELARKSSNIFIIDACRNSPFGTRLRSSKVGLAVMEAPTGTLVAFSTSPGKLAEDGDGRNSPYTKHLIKQLSVPHQPIEKVFKETRRAVIQDTKGRQVPWENTSLAEDVVLNSGNSKSGGFLRDLETK